MDAMAVSDALLAVGETFSSARNVPQLCAGFRSILGDIGEFYYAVGRFRPHSPRDQGIILVEYPEEWARHYRARRYIEIDPTINAIARCDMPFGWEVLADLDTRQQALFDDVRDLGVTAGLTIPTRMADGSTFLASFASLDPSLIQRFRSLLSVVSAQFLEYHSALQDPPTLPVALTRREQDCLTWTARGKSAWDIGICLGISENTVNFHIQNACAKLECKGRMLGVVKAMMLGLITP